MGMVGIAHWPDRTSWESAELAEQMNITGSHTERAMTPDEISVLELFSFQCFLFSLDISADEPVEITRKSDNLGEETGVVMVKTTNVFATDSEVLTITS